jgi:hypothetical protein
MYCDQRSQYIRPKSKKNSFRGNYMRKYGKSKSYQEKQMVHIFVEAFKKRSVREISNGPDFYRDSKLP